ncbi:DUF459 domain-containing protein [Candidatus Poriferisodalis sp.]|uniref:SGNH/GDSL hydrolase family protein n=1 Tax=Candidatus Poriferisodalis sp. TaxID=3101277 RepID=UPI003B5265DA
MPASHVPPDPSTAPAASGPRLDATDRHNGVAAGRVLLAGALGLVLAIVGNSQQLLREAQQKPFGWERDASVAVWEPIEGASSAVGLHLPRLWVDEAFGRSVVDPGATSDEFAVAAEPDSTATATPTEQTSSEQVVATPGIEADTQPGGTAPLVAPGPRPAPADGASSEAGTATGDEQPVTGASDGADNTGETPISAPPTTVAWFPTPDDPLRLHIMGDSMVQFFGHVMVGLANDTGVIEASSEHQLSSGLSRPDFYDWPARIVEVIPATDPDAVVMMYGGNDAQALVVDGQIARPFSEAWVQEYSARVAHVMDLVTTDPDRVLIWVGQPIMESPDYDERMQQVNKVFAAEAAKRDRVIYVDIRDLFRGPNGGFSRYVADADGQLADVRLSDGVHLSTVGGRWLSQVLLDELGGLVDLTSGATS